MSPPPPPGPPLLRSGTRRPSSRLPPAGSPARLPVRGLHVVRQQVLEDGQLRRVVAAQLPVVVADRLKMFRADQVHVGSQTRNVFFSVI